MKFEVVLEKQRDGGYSVYVPKLPGCISQGNDKQEAMTNIREAMGLYLEDLSKNELEDLQDHIQIIEADVKVHA